MDKELNAILEVHSSVFQESLGKKATVKAKIYTESSDKKKNRFFQAGPIAYPLSEKKLKQNWIGLLKREI